MNPKQENYRDKAALKGQINLIYFIFEWLFVERHKKSELNKQIVVSPPAVGLSISERLIAFVWLSIQRLTENIVDPDPSA